MQERETGSDNPMGNNIRACFCVKDFLNFSDLEELQAVLKAHGCILSTSPTINLGKWIEQEFRWKPFEQEWKMRLFQLSLAGKSSSMVSLDVEDGLFLKDGEVNYFPQNEPLFIAYRSLLRDFIGQIMPFIGVIDWDADLACSNLQSTSFATWGNYLSYDFLGIWNRKDTELIEEMTDEIIKVNNNGILTFNHPLGYGDATENHSKYWALISEYIKLHKG
jgi:hypothetical protein